MANRIDSINLTVAQITDLTQPLSLAQGGVGATTPEGGRKTLGFEDLGFGVTNQPALASLDWQQYDFINGAYLLINSSNWTNPPTGFPSVAAGEIWHCEVVGIAGTVIQLQVVTNTVTDSSFKSYSIRITGNKGSRTAKTRRFLTDIEVIPVASGGTGNTTGNAPTATKLATARTLQTNLGSTSSASFDGSANATPGVTGTLALGNGGTGATTATAARTALSAAQSGANNDITSLAGLTTPLSIAQGGTGGNTQATALAALGAVGRLVGVQVITASGTYTKPANVNSLIVEVMGGGGAGGGSGLTSAGQVSGGTGGSSGSYVKHRITSPAASYAVVVGGGGVAASNGPGGAGGNSSFGAVAAGAGGVGGVVYAATTGMTVLAGYSGSVPTPPTVTGGNLAVAEIHPNVMGFILASGISLSGMGGDSPLGVGGGWRADTGTGLAATGKGAGGGGALSTPNTGAGQSGGAGSPGVVIVWEFS